MERPSSGEEGEGDSPNETRISLETAAAEADDSVPYIGQRFLTHEAAYELYSGFAKQCGFSIRRHRTEGKDGVGKGLTRRYFVCHRAGNTPAKPFDDGAKQQRNRKSSRCGCQAYLRIGRDAGAGGLEWRVTGFSNHHNHELLRQDEVRFLPAYRVISDSDRDRILVFAKSGITVQQMMRIMELEKCVQPGSLPFTEKDVRNLIHSFRRFEQEEESVDLLQMCRNVKEKDPNFKYDYTKDASNCLVNIAWSYTLIGASVHGRSYERVKALQSMVSVLVSEAGKSEERMDLATQEVSVLLSRIRQQPVVANVSGDSVRRQR